MVRLENEVTELSDRLEARKLVDRAKGRLIDEGLSESEAYRLMQRAAMDRGLKLDEVAKLVIDGRLGS
jgi:response regulator NasT